MRYAKIENGAVAQYPVAATDIVVQNPDTSFPRGNLSVEVMRSYGCEPVVETQKPQVNRLLQVAEEAIPTLQNGQWTQTWVVRDATADEIAEAKIALQNEVVQQTQARLDAFAKTRGYDGILSACTYATDPNPRFAAEGQYCVALRGNTWALLYQMLLEIEGGVRQPPNSFAEVEALLPVMEWPA